MGLIPLVLTLILAVMLSTSLPLVDAESTQDDSAHEYHNNEWTFLLISFVMTYGAAAVIAGLFTMKYGQKKSKVIAGSMILSGIAIWSIWIYFKFLTKASYPDDTIFGIIYWSTAPILKPLLAVIGVMAGGGLALFVFLTIVVRS